MDSDQVIGASDTYDVDFTGISQTSTSNWPYGSNTVETITISNPYTTGPLTTSAGKLIWDNTSWTEGNTASGKISLQGDDADIDVNGVSLMETLKTIQDRLNMLCPNPEMEAEWDELRAIREQYEAKLAECQEKSRAWKALQQKG